MTTFYWIISEQMALSDQMTLTNTLETSGYVLSDADIMVQ